jgi:uncharacterized protein DUF4383
MKRLAFATSAAFLALGAAAFVPRVAPGGQLFGWIAMGTEQAILFIASGLLGLAFAAAGEASARTFFRLVGIVYAILALMGLFAPEGQLMGMAVNIPAKALHVAIAAWALYLGFFRGTVIVPRGPRLNGA